MNQKVVGGGGSCPIIYFPPLKKVFFCVFLNGREDTTPKTEASGLSIDWNRIAHPIHGTTKPTKPRVKPGGQEGAVQKI